MTHFNFCNPSIHEVTAISARARIVDGSDGKFACLRIVFHGAPGEERELEAYFGAADIETAIATAAAINAVSGIAQNAGVA